MEKLQNYWYEIIPVEKILEEEQYFDDFDPGILCQSIENCGMIYEPVVEKRPDGTYVLRDGHHRLKAAKKLGLKELRCKVYEYNPLMTAYLTFDPNIIRRHLTAEQVKGYEIKKKELLVKIKNQIMNGSSVELSDDEIKLLGKLTKKEYDKLVEIVQKSLEEKYNKIIKEKEEKIKALEKDQVNVEKLQKMVQEKLREKEKELEIKLKEQLASESEQDRVELEKEIERLNAIIEQYKSDIYELNKNLREVTKNIDSIKKEKEKVEEEKKKLEERDKVENEILKKIKDEANYYRMQAKTLEVKLKQQEEFLKTFSKPETIVFQLKSAKELINSSLEVLTRVWGTIDEKTKQEILAEATEIKDFLQIFEDTIHSNGVETVEAQAV